MQKVSRLFKQFRPISYELVLHINRPGRVFSGELTIHGDTPAESDSIKLHSKDLTIESVLVNKIVADFSYNDNDELVLSYPKESNQFVIEINYSGTINDSLHGLYPCYYDHDGVKKELLVTQFESHHAREVLPCIDEPEAKATFDITLETESGVTVLGNMPIKSQKSNKNRLVTRFNTTPIMSSYLLAFVIGELHKKTALTKNGIETNVWATLAQPEDSMDFALDIAVRSTDFFDEYYKTPYPLVKCDHVALPDFGSGAMENWGLITYREATLLAEPNNTSVSSKHYIATVISHELSHQWFGNLVTMKWWNDLWLNESFASLVEYDAIDDLQPDWNVWLDFNSNESIAALRRDSLAGVQAVQTDVNHPDEIGTLFDGAIVYAKGARLMKMMRRLIGDSAFRTGLQVYFEKYKYKNTQANDLWRCLSDASGYDVESLMTPWIRQPGYPVVHLTDQNGEIVLSQERLTSPSTNKPNTLWPITLNSNSTDLPKIFESDTLTIKKSDNNVVRLNIGNDAHFITHYDDSTLKQLIGMVENGVLDPLDRLQLLNEQILLARVGIVSTASLIEMLHAYKNETIEAVWDVISLAAVELRKFVETDTKAELKLRYLSGGLALNMFKKLGWSSKPNEPETDTKLRSLMISMMLYSEDASVIETAIGMFEPSDLSSTDPELRSLVISTKVRHQETDSTIKSLLDQYKTTNSSELKNDITVGLTATKNESTIKLLLESQKDTAMFKTQDTFRWIIYLIRNKYARELTWAWIRDNWPWIKDTFGGDKSYNDFATYSASALVTRKQLKEYRDFFTPLKSDPALTRAVDMGINEITDRVALIERDGDSVRQALLNLE
ncbi:M1 family metallopeptidase [Candidatus Saccharibacteria bacterium]|nr:M1 family metallopeptidase [Candidatus Saccharibacteria bacterium]